MANLARVRTVWSGSPVTGPGVSTFYFDEADSGFLAGVHAFWLALQSAVPSAVSWTTENTGDLIDVGSGVITGSWTDGVSSSVNGTNTNIYAAGVGARIRWRTSGLRGGRRVVGSTFICPMGNDSFDVSGTLSTSRVTLLQTAAGALLTPTTFTGQIWSKPTAGAAGQASPVISAQVPDAVSWLRSRRV